MSDSTNRSLAASQAANTRWARVIDRTAETQASRDGFLARFEREVPAEVTDPGQRARMAQQALTAHMQRLALKSKKSRSTKALRELAADANAIADQIEQDGSDAA